MTTPAPPLTPVCWYCHGVRLVGWSGAGPILCPECSRGEDAFTVITQAWREQRTKVKALESELAQLRREKVDALELIRDLRGYARDWDWKYGAEWDEAERALRGNP